MLKIASPAAHLPLFALLIGLAAPGHALDDFPVYLDAGCGSGTTGGLNNGYAQGPADMLLGQKANGDKTIPVSCAEKLSGSDAMVVKLARTLANGEYWDFGVKFADEPPHPRHRSAGSANPVLDRVMRDILGRHAPRPPFNGFKAAPAGSPGP